MTPEDITATMASVAELIQTVSDLHAQKVCWVIADMLRRSLEEQLRLARRVEALEAEVSALRAENGELKARVAHLEAENAYLKKQLYGKTTERLPAKDKAADEPTTPPPPHPVDLAKVEAAKELARRARQMMREAGAKKKEKGPRGTITELVRRRVPEGLICNTCHGEVKDKGMAHMASELHVAPLTFVTREYLLHRGECGCGEVSFVMPGPPRALDKTEASPELVAKVVMDKFRYHVPIHRQEKIFADSGVFINRSVLNGWVLRAWGEMSPLVKRLWQINRQESHAQCDETPVCSVKDEESKDHFLWCVLTGKAVTFELTEKRNRDEAKRILGPGPKKGVVTDGHCVYGGKTINGKHGGCWAHARRKFFTALLAFPKEAWAVLLIIKDLFLVEREAEAAAKSAEEKVVYRKGRSLVLLNELYTLLLSFNPPPRSSLGKAITYVTKRWPELTAFVEDGRLPIHNNAVESLFRGVKLGFKNFLFVKSELGAQAVAGFYSIVATCGLYGIDPAAYLADVLVKIREGWPQRRLDELLPWNWQGSSAPGQGRIPYSREEQLSAERVIALRDLGEVVHLRNKGELPKAGPPDIGPIQQTTV